jgi:pteridine reductase
MNQTALITGASKRLGKAMASHLASAGWDVIIHYNTSEKAATGLEQQLSALYPEQTFMSHQADLENENAVGHIIPELLKHTDTIHLLINNASIFFPGYLSDCGISEMNQMLRINLKAPFVLMRDFYNQYKQGNIINIVDTRITSNKTDYSAYSLSKKGLWELTKMAALEFAPEVRVNAIAPGVTLPPEDKDEAYLRELAKRIPMKKPGGVLPILQSIDYILKNQHLTGQLLFADGGENLGTNP